MSIGKRGNSKFWYIQFQLNGRTFIKSSKTTDKKLAESLEAEWRRKLIQQSVLGIKERITIDTAVERYLQAKQDLRSIHNLKRHCDLISAHFGKSRYIDDIRSSDIERLKCEFQAQGYAAQTTKHLVNAMRGVCKHARRLGFRLAELEFPTVKLSKGRLRYLTFDEEQRLLCELDPKRPVKGLPRYEDRSERLKMEMRDIRDLVVLLLDTGARHSEIATLEWKAVSLEDRTIRLWRSKVRNESVLFMTDRVHQILTERQKLMDGQVYVFSNRSLGPRNYLGSTLRRAFSRAGLEDCTAHTLRHTHATRLIQNGLNIYEVKEILGHSDIRTTMRYAHLEQKAISAKASSLIDQLTKANL